MTELRQKMIRAMDLKDLSKRLRGPTLPPSQDLLNTTDNPLTNLPKR